MSTNNDMLKKYMNSDYYYWIPFDEYEDRQKILERNKFWKVKDERDEENNSDID